MTRRLLEPILEGGIRHVHFFNGRRLTAEDLEAEQAANREERARLGLAVGYGVISGFEVSEAPEETSPDGGPAAVLKVRAGTAVNALGQTIALPYDQFVALVAPEEPLPEHAGIFGPCEGKTPVQISTGTGAYVLVASPASGFEGRAPAVGFDSSGRVTGCGSRYAVSGVKFGVVRVSPLPGSGDPARLRNRLAHHCFGTEALLASRRVPPEGLGKDGLEAAAPELRPADVPLALFYWSGRSLLFVDQWSVRRRVAAPYPAARWLSYVADSRRAVGEAVFLQFQEEIDWLLAREAGLKMMEAAARFRYLPPAGFLPVGHNEFDDRIFFRPDRWRREDYLGDPAFFRARLCCALAIDPIDVDDPPPIAIYHIPGVDDFVFFIRQDASTLLDRKPEAGFATSEGVTLPGAIEVDIAVAETGGQEGLGEEIRAFLTRGGVDAEAAVRSTLRVTAVDELGKTYEGKLAVTKEPVRLAAARRRFVRALISSLPPGRYRVQVQSSLFRAASRLVDLDPGEIERVLIELVPQEKVSVTIPGASALPNKTIPANWMEYGWYDKAVVIDAYVNPNPLPEEVRRWDPVTDPPPEVKDWLVRWADAVAAKYPGAPVDPAGARILIRPDYVPGDIADEPYAYIEFGENGAHVPVVLVPTHTALEGPVSVHTAGVPGVDQDVGMRLWQLGAGEVDVAGAAWSGLLRDAGLSHETAASVIAEAQHRAAELKTSVKVVPGVDAEIEAVLEEKGLDNAVKLANADPERLVTELGIDRLSATVIVNEARRIVPEESWSLRAGDLGLSEEQVKTLESIGVTTKAALAEKPAEEISEKIGVAKEDAGAIVEKASEAADASRIKLSVEAKAPVALLKEEGAPLSAAVVKSLAESGLKSLKDVAEADENRVAALTGDRKTAEALINAAKARIGLQR